MSAQVKKAGRIGTKFVAVFLFIFLVMFNVQIGMHDGESRDINLLGLSISVFVPNAIASYEAWGECIWVDDHGGGGKGCKPCAHPPCLSCTTTGPCVPPNV